MAEEKQKDGGISDAAARKAGEKITTKVSEAAVSKFTTAAGSSLGPAGTIIGHEVGRRLGKIGADAASFGKRNTKKVLGGLGVGILGLGSLIGAIPALAFGAIGTGIAALGSALIIALIAVPITVAFFLLIINNSAYMVPPATSLAQISLFEDRIIENADCPILNGTLLFNNPMWGSYQSSILGHGSKGPKGYWESIGRSCTEYSIPQQSGCYGAPGNACQSSGPYSKTCPHYGYALDINGPGNIVVLPRIGEESVSWNRIDGWVKGTGNYTNIYTDNEGKYTLVLTHMDRPTSGNSVPSGTQIGLVGNSGGTPHLHVEFQADGIWVKPDNYFCR